MIVCAALRYGLGPVVIGPRHFDSVMQERDLIHLLAEHGRPDQGFIDQHGKFYTREEAWTHAHDNSQHLINLGKWPPGRLYSENLY